MPLIDPADLELSTLRALSGLPAGRVIEIGTGDGRLAWALAGLASLWVALDPDTAEVRGASVAPRDPTGSGVRLLAADGRALPFPAGSFDLALFTWSLC